MSVNKVILMGFLGRDPELEETNTGKMRCRLSIATDYRTKEGKQTDWHWVTAWGKTAEVLANYLKKGNPVYIEGRLSYWGEKKEKTDIVVENFSFVGRKEGEAHQ